MGCLKNLVGIKGACSDTGGPFQFYVNQLPGITLEAAEASVNSEKESAFALLQEKIDFAQDIMKTDIRGTLIDKMRLDSLIDEDTIGMYSDNMPSQAAEGYYKGAQIRMMGNANAEVIISAVRLFCQHTGEVTIKIFDLVQGKEVHSFTIDAVAGEIVEKIINSQFPVFSKWLNLAVVYDSSAIESYESRPYTGIAGCMSCGPFAGMFTCGGFGTHHYAYARGIKLPLTGGKRQENILPTSNTSGLSFTYSLNCSPEPLMCKLAPSLAYPLLRKSGVEIMKEFRFSRRLNSIISMGKLDHKELETDFQTDYLSAMDDIFKNIRLPDDICYRCAPKTKNVTTIP